MNSSGPIEGLVKMRVKSECCKCQPGVGVGAVTKMVWFVNQLKSVRMNFLEYWYEGIWDLQPTHQKTLKISIRVCRDQEIETLTDALRTSRCNAPSQVMESIHLFYELCRCEVHGRLSWDARKKFQISADALVQAWGCLDTGTRRLAGTRKCWVGNCKVTLSLLHHHHRLPRSNTECDQLVPSQGDCGKDSSCFHTESLVLIALCIL